MQANLQLRLHSTICPFVCFNRIPLYGKERDTESGLDYFGARYYCSNMGRWMSPDWADKPEAVPYSSLENPQSLNLYGYVLNNPLSKADSDGHAGCPPDCSTGNNVVDFFLTAANAFSSDNLAGAGRVNQTSPGGQLGAQLGDVGAMVQRAAQVVLGTGGNIAGVGLDATGVAAAVGVPVNVVSTAVTVEGARPEGQTGRSPAFAVGSGKFVLTRKNHLSHRCRQMSDDRPTCPGTRVHLDTTSILNVPGLATGRPEEPDFASSKSAVGR